MFFGFQTHSTPPDMTRSVCVPSCTAGFRLAPQQQALAVFTGPSARSLFSLDTLDSDTEMDNTPVNISIYSEAHLTPDEPDSAQIALGIASQIHQSLEGEDRISGSAGISTAASTPLLRCKRGRQLVLHELGFRAIKKPRLISPLNK